MSALLGHEGRRVTVQELIESLSTDVFEPRTTARNETFSSLALIVGFLFINSSCKC